ncbi:flavonoid 3-O-glucosyltransferase-like [Arachis stenosperma]|uniref:flavonoid 3-O-glucosyltransferase-like n=1 Tax=Arachis stenosperma TaxID=217475 RepID=UPI0025AC4E97|nr:flavonoid 3-O-glucosyltransferase-like [Arachis stenosperma]
MNKVVCSVHVAVLAFPFGSHAAPLLNVVQEIASKNPRVKFSFLSTKRSNESIFAGIIHHNIKAYNVEDGLPEGYVPSGHPIEPINLFVGVMIQNFKRAMDKALAETHINFTCLLTDAFLWFAAEMAKEINAKWVPVWTAGPHSLLCHLMTDFIRDQFAADAGNGIFSIDFVPGLPVVKASELPEGIIDDIEQPLSSMLHKMGQTLPKATAVAINSFAELEPPIVNQLESKFRKLLNIGPFTLALPQPNIPDDQGCIEWLNKHDIGSVVYISFGTVIIPPPHELVAIAEAIDESGFPFIWSFRGKHDEQLPKGLLERIKDKGKIVSWSPQVEILKHEAIGVCVTHSGWNSIMECMVGGVPMISRPFFGDQKLNTRMMEGRWGVGVPIQDGVFTKEATLAALKSTMSSDEGMLMRQKISEFKKSAKRAVETNGSFIRDFNTLVEIVTS